VSEETGFLSKVEQTAHDAAQPARRMRLRYGFNEINGWWHFSRGVGNAEVRRHLRLMDTRIIRIFAFDQPVPDPFRNWLGFSIYVQGVLDAGAVPMITFARFHPPFDDPDNVASFAARCREIVWSCIEQWGGESVRDWFFCIWNEPNNPIVGGDLTYEHYRRIYLAVAGGIMELLAPHLDGRKARIGGPAIDGNHRPYWMDWIAQLVHDVDDSLVGFVSWHRYGDWRPAVPSPSLGLRMWGAPDSPSGAVFEDLLMGQTPTYESRARGVARLVRGRDILNICGELNTISHHENYYTLGLNQNAFGAAFYASALIHLIRGGADVEMRWTATAHGDDAYGLLTMSGEAMPAGLAKQIFAQHVRFGDWVRFPKLKPSRPEIDALVAWHDDGRLSGVFVNTARGPSTVRPADWDSGLAACDEILRIDTGTGRCVLRESYDGTIRFDGYGVAIVTNAAAATILD
jgi:Glycosyl hydrolases family 39